MLAAAKHIVSSPIVQQIQIQSSNLAGVTYRITRKTTAFLDEFITCRKHDILYK